MSLLDRITTGATPAQRMTTDEYVGLVNSFSLGGVGYGYSTPLSTGVQQTLVGGEAIEMAPSTFVGLASQAYAANGVVFSCMLVRQLVFSSIRFRWQRLRDGKPSDTFGSPELGILERPWVGGTTQDMLSRMIQDADLAGNSYWTIIDGEFVRMRPDWVDVVVEERIIRGGRSERGGGQVGWRKVGYLYHEGGRGASDGNSVAFLADEVVHYAPIPDPLASYRGMSWITPVLREIQADQAMTRHQSKFFTNGAPQPLDAKIMTPTGWSTMGAMKVGDRVIGSDGKPHDVVAVYPQGEQDIYRVNFSNGTSTECTRDHLWSVASAYDRKRGVTRTMTLGEIIDGGVAYDIGPAKWSVPLVSPIEFDDAGELPVHPYLLGSLLGDGCMRANSTGTSGTPKLACHLGDADEQQRLIAGLLPSGVAIVRQKDQGNCVSLYFSRVKGGARTNALTQSLRDLGLFDCIGHQKFVPDAYMRGSVTDRLALLQGLLDTDGSVSARQDNDIRFTSTSETLATQVAELASGLGGIGTVRLSRPARGGGRPQWTARICRLPEWIVPFRIARKAGIYNPTVRGGAYRYIRSVELVGRKQAQCISVDSDDHLYVTDDFILTHNTVNMIIKHSPLADPDAVRRWADEMQSKHGGADNAWKNLNLYPGADATPVGSNLREIDFKDVRGGGETRIAAAAGVPPVIVGLSEGLAAATYSNYGQARRRLADGTAHPLWQNLASSIEHVITKPRGAGNDVRLWYDADNVPFLREDEKDAAAIAKVRAETISTLITAGYEPDSVVAAVNAGDLRLLSHTGLTSVQLLPPGTSATAITQGGAA